MDKETAKRITLMRIAEWDTESSGENFFDKEEVNTTALLYKENTTSYSGSSIDNFLAKNPEAGLDYG